MEKPAKQKPSFTAFLIPKILPAVARVKKYRPLVTRQQVNISRRFADECAKNDLGIKLLHNLVGRRLAIWLANNIGIKGLPVHYAARKKYIRDKFESVAAEIAQVVMIGAGFDTFCLEYGEKYPGVKFFELDQMVTQNIKLAALKKMPQFDGAENLKFIACDLSRESLAGVLEANGFDSAAKSFFIIEGVLMYLQKADAEKLLADIYAVGAGGSYIVFGSMSELKMAGDKRAILSDAALGLRKEKYKFAATPGEIKRLLETAGFKLLETRLYHELQRDIESETKVKLLAAERGEHYYFAAKL